MIKNNDVTLFSSASDLFQFAAKDFCDRAMQAISEKSLFSVVLSGGNTPKLFFDALTHNEYSQKNIPWQHIQFFFGDERYVPADNVESNYHMAYEYLFSKVPVNSNNIYRIPTQFSDPKDAAKEYEKILREAFHLKADAFPPFDLLYLGLGNDAHTASLMPFSEIVMQPPLKEDLELVASLFVSESNLSRITLTPNAINHSKDIIFLVTGENKALAAREVLEGQEDPQRYPAQLIHSVKGKTIWYLDQAAASKLTIKSKF